MSSPGCAFAESERIIHGESVPCHLITLRCGAPRYTSGLLGSARLMTNRLCRHLSYKYKQRPRRHGGSAEIKTRAHTSCLVIIIFPAGVCARVLTRVFFLVPGSRRKKCVSPPKREMQRRVCLIPQEFPNWILCVISHISQRAAAAAPEMKISTRE